MLQCPKFIGSINATDGLIGEASNNKQTWLGYQPSRDAHKHIKTLCVYTSTSIHRFDDGSLTLAEVSTSWRSAMTRVGPTLTLCCWQDAGTIIAF